MLARCENPGHASYDRYGGRGIVVCERWHDFANFLADMGQKPHPGLTLERKNNDGNYEPGNVEWATVTQQARNKRNNHVLEWNGERMSIAAWAERLGVRGAAIARRINLGWSVDRALTEPLRMRKTA